MSSVWFSPAFNWQGDLSISATPMELRRPANCVTSLKSAYSQPESNLVKTHLPLELVLNVARKIREDDSDEATTDLNHLSQLDKQFHSLVTPLLYERVMLYSFAHPAPVDAAAVVHWDEESSIQAGETFARISRLCRVIQSDVRRPAFASMVKQLHLDLLGCMELYGRSAQSVVALLPRLHNLQNLITQTKFSQVPAITALFQYIAAQVRLTAPVLQQANLLIIDNVHNGVDGNSGEYRLCHIQLNSEVSMAIQPYQTKKVWAYNGLTLPFLRFALVCLISHDPKELHLYMQDSGSSDFRFCNTVSTLHLHKLRSDTMVADLLTIPVEIKTLNFNGDYCNLYPCELNECLANANFVPNLRNLSVNCDTYGYNQIEGEQTWEEDLSSIEAHCNRRGISLHMKWRRLDGDTQVEEGGRRSNGNGSTSHLPVNGRTGN